MFPFAKVAYNQIDTVKMPGEVKTRGISIGRLDQGDDLELGNINKPLIRDS
jgi:hypothetical protein